MAGEEITLGTTPEALKKRQADVTLDDGSTVKVYKWSILKHPELLPLIADLKNVPKVARESVAEADREKVDALDFGDQMEIANTAIELNVDARALKNFSRFLSNAARLVEATKKSAL